MTKEHDLQNEIRLHVAREHLGTLFPGQRRPGMDRQGAAHAPDAGYQYDSSHKPAAL